MAKILVFDDDNSIRMLYAEELRDHGYDVVDFEKPALEAIAREQPDLVMLDRKFPYCDGLEFLKELRGVYKSLPVIIISGYEKPGEARAPDYYVNKSHDLTGLTMCIERALDYAQAYQSD